METKKNTTKIKKKIAKCSKWGKSEGQRVREEGMECEGMNDLIYLIFDLFVLLIENSSSQSVSQWQWKINPLRSKG